jgi:hypothetical protein
MLKEGRAGADGLRMFMPCSDEPLVAESAIVAFCAALNTPVLNIDALEVGPARAGIMIAAGNSGELNLLVRVCLLSSGEGVTFEFQGDPAEFGDAQAAMAAALSFSEGMGFLFEEDLMAEGAPAGRQRAIKIWKSLCSPREEATPGDVSTPPVESTRTESNPQPRAEIEPTQSFDQMPASASPDGRKDSVGSPILTKFRGAAVAMGESASLPAPTGKRNERRSEKRRQPRRRDTNDSSRRRGSKELGRVKLASEVEVRDESGFLTQLLISF